MLQKNKKPNILFIMADQLRADVLGCYGGNAKTPAIDMIANEGLQFTECCTVSPLCVPARVSLMTGLYPHTTGVWNNTEFVLSPEAPLWTKKIHESGYNTSVFGKLHLHTDFGDMIKREYLVHGYGFETVNEVSGPHSTCQTRTHMSDEWKKKGLWEDYCSDMLSRTKGPYSSPSPLPISEYYDTYVGRKAKEYLEEYSDNRPWFCYVSFPGPHEPWDAPYPYSEMYQSKQMSDPLPLVYDEEENRPTGEYDKLLEKKIIHCDQVQSKEIQANYCGSVSLIDNQIATIIDVIKKRGDWDNTVVILTSDHGELNGDHGLIHKRNFFRPVLNVPLIIRTPETLKNKEKKSDTLVNLIDIGPTLAEIAGNPIDYEQFGKSLCPYLKNSSKEHRRCILSEYNGELMYYDRKWKAVFNKKSEIYLLFHTESDPIEVRNLASMPNYNEIEVELKNKMLSLLQENFKLTPELIQIPVISEDEVFPRSVVQE